MAITPLQSRIEEILSGSKTITPQSRIEVLLIELMKLIEESGEASAYHYKGSVNSVNDLPESAEVGDVYNVIATGMNYAWTGTEWDSLGWIVEVISTILENSQSPVTSAAIYSALVQKADLSILTPMTQAQYDALVTKIAPLYFIYEDGEST